MHDVQERMHISIQELEKQDNYRNEFLATLAHIAKSAWAYYVWRKYFRNG